MKKLTVREAAALLRTSEKNVDRWIKQGVLPASLINDEYRINRTELLEWATARKMDTSPEIFAEAEAGPPSTLEDALRAGGIHYRVAGRDKESVLRSVIDTMDLPEDVDPEFFYKVLLAREALGSTGIGEGIAIPHVRNPIILHVSRPIVALCFLEQSVDFSALDGERVSTLFTILSPTVRAHLQLLSRIAFTLRDPSFKAALLKQASREEIFEALHAAESAVTASAPKPRAHAGKA